ncbi:alpha/beta hydrolase [Pseudolysinimonas sp.]|uniref:alpha/beta hydrolase n=1 Tax=Pseudolysinimonas sp. TaxID=2680009 RepID=UPI003F821A98
MSTLLPGITARQIPTARLRTNILERPGDAADGTPVVLVHGNVSSAAFFQPFMLSLPSSWRVVAVDLRGFGDSETTPVDATRGLRDFADDLAETVGALGLAGDPHLFGWSMGGGVVLQYALDHSVASLALQAPVSPYGFGATALDGSLLTPDAAGSGGGGGNPDFVAALQAGDTGDGPASPRTVYRTAYVHAGHADAYEDLWVESMLSTATGVDNYPGDSRPSDNWPGFAPGDRGVLNTMTPDHLDLSGIAAISPKPPILWVHGDSDAIVADASFFDLNQLGALGVVPGWPGVDVAPAQPMVAQTRAVLGRYRDGGGTVTELVLEACGHSPHVEYPDLVRAALEELVAGD